MPPPADVSHGVEADVVQEGEDEEQDLGRNGLHDALGQLIARPGLREERQPLEQAVHVGGLVGESGSLRSALHVFFTSRVCSKKVTKILTPLGFFFEAK